MFRQPWPKGEMVNIGKSTPKDLIFYPADNLFEGILM
jgi:hypothetical protein